MNDLLKQLKDAYEAGDVSEKVKEILVAEGVIREDINLHTSEASAYTRNGLLSAYHPEEPGRDATWTRDEARELRDEITRWLGDGE